MEETKIEKKERREEREDNLVKTAVPFESRSHTHPSHSQTSRLLTSSLSLGVPVPSLNNQQI
jgi:hypothetical protein